MRTIELTQGYEALVDDEDYDKVSHIIWYADVRPDGAVYARGNVKLSCGRRTTVQLHRIIMDAPIGIQVDHRDRNGINCQKYNMRLCTDGENKRNATRLQTESGSGYRGVRRLDSGRYTTRLNMDKVCVYNQSFDTIEEAIRAYNKIALMYHGEFATLNEIPEAF